MAYAVLLKAIPCGVIFPIKKNRETYQNGLATYYLRAHIANANLLIACTQVAGETSLICFVIVLIWNVTQHGIELLWYCAGYLHECHIIAENSVHYTQLWRYIVREHPFSTYARRGGGGLNKSVRRTMSLLVTVTSFCVRERGRGSKKAELLRTY